MAPTQDLDTRQVVPSQPGWEAELQLRYGFEKTRTLLRHQHVGPLRVQRPFYPEGEVNHTYLLHPPGGLVGDDVLRICGEVAPGAHALITMPGATKAYRNVTAGASIDQQFVVGGTLEYLPLETILFAGSRLRSQTHFELLPGARFISWEVICLGRLAGRQDFACGRADFRTTVSDTSGPLFDDRLRFGGTDAMLTEPWGLNGCSVAGVMLAYPADESLLVLARASLPDDTTNFAVTLLGQLLVVRALTRHSQDVHRAFRSVWSAIRSSLVGKAPCAPRIWTT